MTQLSHMSVVLHLCWGFEMRRVFAVVATAVVAVGGFAGSASAETTLPLCTPNDGYIPGETCEAAVTASVECVDGAPVLDYAVPARAVGGAGTVDVTWTNLPGADVVLADQPLTVDNVRWPAGADAEVTLVFATTPAETRVNLAAPTDCVEGLVLPAPQNPSTGTPTTGNPVAPAAGVAGSGVAAAGTRAAGTAATDRTRSRSASGVLAETGSTVLPLALGGGALIAGGAALVLVRGARRLGAHRA